MIQLRTLFIFTGFLLLLLHACTKAELDVTPPSLQFITLVPEPFADEICGEIEDSVFHLKGGAQLQFMATFKDNSRLSQYKIDIHNDFDCHGHGAASAPSFSIPNLNNQTEDLTVLQTIDLAGSKQTVTYNLTIPTNVTAGDYHFQIQVIDESGNDDPSAYLYSLKIIHPTDSIAPQIMATEPDRNFSVTKGQKIHFTGTVTDAHSLSEGGNGVLFLAYTDRNSGNTFTTDSFFPFESNITNNFSFDFDYTIPETLLTGNYFFTLNAQDGVRNRADAIVFEVAITN